MASKTLVSVNCPTRLCFRVARPEQGRLILGAGHTLELPRTIPGRCVALVGEELVVLQGYYLDDEALLAIARQVGGEPAAPPLSAEEMVWVRYAVEHLDGTFRITDLEAAFGQPKALRRIARRWEARGWLTPAQPGQQARQVTAELRDLAGL